MNTFKNNNKHNLLYQEIKDNNNKNDIKINNIDISKPKSLELNSTSFKDINNNNCSHSNARFENNSNIRSIDFYALGKINNYQKINSFIPPNNGFRSTSNNLLKRNYFSINNRYFDKLKIENLKKQATIYEQNINENNYLTPINVFNSVQNYNLPSNVVNQETYNIAKEKLFAKDIISSIKKGRQISKKDFFIEKQNLMGIKDKKLLTPNNKSLNFDNLREMKRYNSYINIKENKKDNNFKEENNKSRNDKKLVHSLSNKAFISVNPKDFTKEVLKNTIMHFDKNNSQIIRDRNWWKINK